MTYAAALHGDVVGYSSLIADNEIETFRSVQKMRSVVESAATTHDGHLAAFVGDEFLVVFPDAQTAVETALLIQREVVLANGSLSEGRKVRFRLGVQVGSIGQEGDSFYGDTINVAARLQALGDPGGVTISGDVLAELADVPVRVKELGSRRLKNIPEPVSVFKLVDDVDLPSSDRPWRRLVVTHDAPSLAVVPFVNLGDKADDFFASGLTISLISSLVRVPGIDVVSGNSTITYSYRAVSAEQVAAETSARFVLEGAVQRSDDRVRVIANLLDTEKGKMVWSERFDNDLGDLLTTEDALVDQIVSAIDTTGFGPVGRPVARLLRDQLDSASVELVYKGQSLLMRATPEEVREARALFLQATKNSPESAIGPAMAGWAHLWEMLLGYAAEPETSLTRAEDLANQAQKLGDPTGFSFAVLAYTNLLRHHWQEAYESAVHATEWRPSCDASFGVAASVMRFLGHWETAVQMAKRASDLSPVRNNWYQSILANSYFVGDEHQAASEVAESVLARNENMTEATLTLAAAQASLGRTRHARAAARQALESRPGLDGASVRASMPFKDQKTLDTFVSRLHEAGLD